MKNKKFANFFLKINYFFIFLSLFLLLYTFYRAEIIYESLARKIERIRDKKISIQHVVTEFTKIHLQSFKYHLNKSKFDIVFADQDREFMPVLKGKKIQLDNIKIFLKKHLY